MKTIRLIAGSLLLITFVLHIIVYTKMKEEPSAAGLLVFGVIYGIIGLLLFTKKMYPVYLGLIIPLIGLIAALINFGIPELVSMETLLHLIDIVVIICCAVLLINRKKPA